MSDFVSVCSHTKPMYKSSAGSAFQNLDNNTSGFLPTHTWNYASTTCIFTGSIDIHSSSSVSTSSPTSSSSISFVSSMSAGDIMVSLLLFCWLIIYLGSMVAHGLSGINTKKKYLNYSRGNEVEITENL